MVTTSSFSQFWKESNYQSSTNETLFFPTTTSEKGTNGNHTQNGIDQEIRDSNRANTRYLAYNSKPESGIKSWGKFKWLLIVANTLLFIISMCILFIAIITYGKGYVRAEVLSTGNTSLVGLIMAIGIVGLTNSILGYYGIYKNSRRALAIWTLILWILLVMYMVVGYLAYKRSLWNLRAKLGHQWRNFDYQERIIIQNNLHCCGFKGPFDHAALSNKCYLRSLLPGCLGKFYRFSAMALKIIFIAAFTLLVPILATIFIGTLASNHINNKFNRDPPPRLTY
ncbi:hypothetical protein K7432_005047 [Basidiobolus ranarum]|uniref:Tetraspanin n=1 Tax=Basidiobolus ranarum TaxID=34480 RepID=A0ABR2WXB1_9FUNG